MQKLLIVLIILVTSIPSICLISLTNEVHSQVTSLGENFGQFGSNTIDPPFSASDEDSLGPSSLDDLFSSSNSGINAEPEKIEFILNQSTGLKNHKNSDYHFNIEYPQDWNEEPLTSIYDFGDSKTIFKIGASTNNPDSMRTSANTVISIKAENTSSTLNPNTLKVESLSAQDYGNNEVGILSQPMDFGGMQATHDITRNNATDVSGLPSWRVDYITNISGIQSSYQSKVFVVNEDTLFTIDFFTDPLKVPETLPIFEQVLKSFKFTA